MVSLCKPDDENDSETNSDLVGSLSQLFTQQLLKRIRQTQCFAELSSIAVALNACANSAQAEGGRPSGASEVTGRETTPEYEQQRLAYETLWQSTTPTLPAPVHTLSTN